MTIVLTVIAGVVTVVIARVAGRLRSLLAGPSRWASSPRRRAWATWWTGFVPPAGRGPRPRRGLDQRLRPERGALPDLQSRPTPPSSAAASSPCFSSCAASTSRAAAAHVRAARHRWLQTRLLPVPDGLDQMRLDAADGPPVRPGGPRPPPSSAGAWGRSARQGRRVEGTHPVRAGQLLEVRLPEPLAGCPGPRRPSAACRSSTPTTTSWSSVRPVGAAVHASPGWVGPTVVDGIAAQGLRVSTSGAAERRGRGAPPRRGHQRGAGGRGQRAALLHGVEARLSADRAVDKRYPALVQGHPDPEPRQAGRRAHRPAPGRGTTSSRSWQAAGPSVTHYDTVEAFPAASLLDIDPQTGRTHQIRVHIWPPSGIRVSAT